MARPDRLNWINQAVHEVATVLRASTDLMAASALTGGKGVVLRIDEHDLDRATMSKHSVIYAAVRYVGHNVADADTAGTTDYEIDVAVHLEGKVPAGTKAAERQGLWKMIQRAASVVDPILQDEITAGGGQFASFCQWATPLGGNAQQFEDDSGYYAIIDTGMRLHVTLAD